MLLVLLLISQIAEMAMHIWLTAIVFRCYKFLNDKMVRATSYFELHCTKFKIITPALLQSCQNLSLVQPFLTFKFFLQTVGIFFFALIVHLL
jgi:hypothetical protein